LKQPIDTQGKVIVIGIPNKFNPSDNLYLEIEPGLCIREIVGDKARDSVVVFINGNKLKRDQWTNTITKAGDIIEIVDEPEGFLASIFGALLASKVSAAIVSFLGITGTWATIISGALTVLGIKALIPPLDTSINAGKTAKPQNRYYSLVGSQNRELHYEPIPKVYGTYRYYPPYAASFYTESAGEDQYLRLLFCLGYGPLKIGGQIVGKGYAKRTQADLDLTNIKIGETSLSEYDNYSLEIGTADQITLYSNDVNQIDPGVTFTEVGQEATRTTGQEASEISIDFHFPQGLWSMNDRAEESISSDYVTLDVYIDGVKKNSITIHGKKDPFSYSYKYWLSTEDYHDIRVVLRDKRHVHGKYTYGEVQWFALRAVKHRKPFNLDNVVLCALNIKATDQLSGTLDNFNVVAQSVLPVWNGLTWNLQPTNNPAWAYCDVLMGEQSVRPTADSKIDLPTILQWANWCNDNGFEYNWVHTDQETVISRLRAIATTGRAAWSINNGKFSVIMDDADKPPTQLITPRNSWGFTCDKTFVRIPHALRVNYIDPTNWQEAERIVYDDGYNEANATYYETLETQGVTNAEQAWKVGRYYLATMRLRPEEIKVNMDIENLRSTRGDRVLVAHDVMLVGTGWGRVKDVIINDDNSATIILDEKINFDPAKTYSVQARTVSGNVFMRNIYPTPETATNTFTITSPINNLNVGDLVVVGESGIETRDCLITRIEPQSDLSATITLVDRAPEIYQADAGPIPPFDPRISLPYELRSPLAPIIISLEKSTTVAITQPDGTLTHAIIVTLAMPENSVKVDSYQIKYYTDSIGTRYKEFQANGTKFILNDVPEGETIIVTARAKSINGLWGPWSATKSIIGEPMAYTPQEVTNIQAVESTNIQNDGSVRCNVILSWTDPPAWCEYIEILVKEQGAADYVSCGTVRKGTQNYVIYGLAPAQTINIKLRVIDVYGNTSQGEVVELQLHGKEAPPSMPTNIRFESSVDSIALFWDNPDDYDLDYIEINQFKGAAQPSSPSEGTIVGRTSGNMYTIGGLEDMYVYWYWLRAVDTSGNVSDWTEPVMIVTKHLASQLLDFRFEDSELAEKLSEDILNKAIQNDIDYHAERDRFQTNRAAVINERTARATEDEALATQISTLTSNISTSISELETSIQNEATTRATEDEALATQISTVSASVDDAIASIQENALAIANVDGRLRAQWTIQAQAAGTHKAVAGIGLFADGQSGTSEFVILADKFFIYNPANGTVKPVFQLINNNAYLDGNIIATGTIAGNKITANSISADRLNVNALSAISANLGTVTAGIAKSADGKLVIDLANRTIKVYDDNNNLRVQLGAL
jgi:predicted phage tail protein